MSEIETLRRDGYVVARYSERIQRMLGYSVVDGLFYGHVNGRDPIKLIRKRDSDATRA